MGSDLETLEAHLIAQPDDREAWLVYADRLTERGDVRGELIVVEDRLAREALPHRLRRAMNKRRIEIVAEHEATWLDGWEIPDEVVLVWERGFVTGAHLKHDAAALDDLGRLVSRPVGRFFRSLRSGYPWGVDLNELSQHPILERVTHLSFEGTGVGVQVAQALARSPKLGRLIHLDLDECRLGEQGLRVLIAPEVLYSLRTLWISGNGIGRGGVRALAEAGTLGELIELDLRGSTRWGGPEPLDGEDIEALPDSTALRSLARLDLSGNAIGDGGVASLARGSGLGRLAELDLSGCHVSPAGARALARSEAPWSLQKLTLNGDPVGDEGVVSLAESPRSRSLTHLKLKGCSLGPPTAQKLAGSSAFPALTHLDLRQNDFGGNSRTQLETWASERGFRLLL